MKFEDLPQGTKDRLMSEKKELYKKSYIRRSDLLLIDKSGSRYLRAFYNGNGTISSKIKYWAVKYGAIGFAKSEGIYKWVETKKRFSVSSNGVFIPSAVSSKNKVLEIAKAIGIFEI